MPTTTRGAIVLAAYQPDPQLLRGQLESLQAQTVRDWECVISVDGDPEPIAALVADIVADDSRFRVVGDGSRLGFYLNFERGLLAVAEGTAWIALSDQDDRWDADKLQRLLPHLAEVSLVSGQARLVTYPQGRLTGQTDRRDVGDDLVLLSNQFTGSLCVFDGALLTTALPFPRVSTRVATHDHWLAVVAGVHRGTRVIEQTVQDYVQHAANVFGDPSRLGGGSIASSIRNALRQADRYEGGRSPAAVARMTFWTYVGWRQLMVDTLHGRHDGGHDTTRRKEALFGAGRRYRALDALLRDAVKTGFVPRRFAAEYRVSWLAGALSGGRSRVAAVVRQSEVEPS